MTPPDSGTTDTALVTAELLGPALDAASSWIALVADDRVIWMNQPLRDAVERLLGRPPGPHARVPLACWPAHLGSVTSLRCPCPAVESGAYAPETLCRPVPTRLPVAIVSHAVPSAGPHARLCVITPPAPAHDGWTVVRQRGQDLIRALQAVLPDPEPSGTNASADLGEGAVRPPFVSPREWAIVRGLMAHKDLGTVSAELGISIHTTRNHLKSVFRKLNVHSQRQLLRLVHRPPSR